MYDLIRNIINTQLKIAPPDTEYLFGEITQNKYRKRWYKYCEVNDIPRVTPYEIRHTFVPAIQGLPESTVKKPVGHSRNMDTFGVYGHTSGKQDQTETLIASGL